MDIKKSGTRYLMNRDRFSRGLLSQCTMVRAEKKYGLTTSELDVLCAHAREISLNHD